MGVNKYNLQAYSKTFQFIHNNRTKTRENDVSDKSILFSDRPERIVTSVSTSDYIGNWTTEDNSFAVDAPNAVLIVDEAEGKQGETIIELFNPVYDSDKKILKYDITPDNATSIELPKEFGQSTLVIDDGAYAGQTHGSNR